MGGRPHAPSLWETLRIVVNIYIHIIYIIYIKVQIHTYIERSIYAYILGETETMIDHILVNNKYRSQGCESNPRLRDSQHYLLLMNTVFKKKVRRKVKFSKKN